MASAARHSDFPVWCAAPLLGQLLLVPEPVQTDQISVHSIFVQRMNRPTSSEEGFFGSAARVDREEARASDQSEGLAKDVVAVPDDTAAALAAAAYEHAEAGNISQQQDEYTSAHDPNSSLAGASGADIGLKEDDSAMSDRGTGNEVEHSLHHDHAHHHTHEHTHDHTHDIGHTHTHDHEHNHSAHDGNELLQSVNISHSAPSNGDTHEAPPGVMYQTPIHSGAGMEANVGIPLAAYPSSFGGVPAVPTINAEGTYESKKKRRQYKTEEERRQARIIKNRRTAEESRQRRLRKMKELEESARLNNDRAKELEQEVLALKDEIVRLKAAKELDHAVDLADGRSSVSKAGNFDDDVNPKRQ